MKKLVFLSALAILLSSCYSQYHVVGQGAQGNNEVTEWNHYLIGGLAPVGVSKPEDLANGKEDYTEHTRLTFVNGLLSAITFGLYSPTTTTVKY